VQFVLSWIGRKAAFVYPVQPPPRVAVLEPWFRSPKPRSPKLRSPQSPQTLIRVFERGWCAAAAAYEPEAIAGRWPRLEALMNVKIDSLTHAVIVLARVGDDLLTIERRQRLWNAFRVPIFEQIIGVNGVLLAAECEAHAGLHIESAKFNLASRLIETAPCGCGRPGPRLKPVEQIKPARAAAAHAR
jgi:hypothetical protein